MRIFNSKIENHVSMQRRFPSYSFKSWTEGTTPVVTKLPNCYFLQRAMSSPLTLSIDVNIQFQNRKSSDYAQKDFHVILLNLGQRLPH